MRLLPVIPGTVALWQFQGSLADSGPNGLTPETLNAFTSNPGGTEQYGPFDSCVQGFKFDGGTKLLAPNSPLLRSVNAWTIQFLMYQSSTLGGGQSWFSLVDPIRNGPPDAIGSLYTFFWHNLTPGPHPYWADKSHGSNLPVPGGAWWTTTDAVWSPAFHAIAVRYAPVPAVGIFIDMFVDGVKQTPNAAQPMSTTFETPTGAERFYIGGCDGSSYTPTANSLIASMRVLNYARSDADILADATAQLGPCAAAFAYRGVKIRMTRSAT